MEGPSPLKALLSPTFPQVRPCSLPSQLSFGRGLQVLATLSSAAALPEVPAGSQTLLAGAAGQAEPSGLHFSPHRGGSLSRPHGSPGHVSRPIATWGKLGSGRALSAAFTPSINSAVTPVPSDSTDPPARAPVRAQGPAPRCWVNWKVPFVLRESREGAQQLSTTHQDPPSPSGLSISWLGDQLGSDGAWLFSISQRNG